MKSSLLNIALLVVTALAISPLATVQSFNQLNQDEQELKNLTRLWDEALRERNIETLSSILAEDYIASGISKTQYLSLIKATNYTYTSASKEIFEVRNYGDTAILFGSNTIAGRSQGVDSFSNTYNFMDVWIKRQGRWQCAASMADQLEFSSETSKVLPIKPDKNNLLIYFKAGVTEEQINYFVDDVLHKPYVKGRGADLQDGVCQLLRMNSSNQGQESLAISFCANSTQAQLENLKTKITALPLVSKVDSGVTFKDNR